MTPAGPAAPPDASPPLAPRAPPLAPAAPHPAAKRWLLDVSAWTPAPGELEWLAAQLPAEDAAAVMAYRQDADRRRALGSR